MSWIAESFLYASGDTGKPIRADGKTYRGLGILDRGGGRWRIVHINTGFTLCHLVLCAPTRALEIATEFAEAGDWDFAGPNGWQNLEPELMERSIEIGDRWRGYVDWGNGANGSAEIAQGVAAARLN